jgi:tRNA (cmo5U34)-methyltransferase
MAYGGDHLPPSDVGATMDGEQFHLNSDAYLEMIRAEIPGYDDLQDALAAATVTRHPAERILDLGSGTGETAKTVLRRHPDARLVGIDASADMLEIAGNSCRTPSS